VLRYVDRMTRYRALGGGATINYFRDRSGLSIAQLAEIVGLHRVSLSEQISGKRPMPWEVAARIAQEFDVPPHVLVEPIHQPDDTEAVAQ
jgi:plasmid maintenance system antidote protein VapI